MNPVRLYLALLLAAQFLVPLVPSWGAFVPHDHWARARISPADWSAHLEEHRIGPVAATAVAPHTDKTQINSTLAQNGLTSLQAPLADHDSDFEFALAPRVLLHRVLAHEFIARALSYPPLNPPPTLRTLPT